ncbi:MAG: DUF2062 domain-containing protein [Desulfobacteraceae bacterium]|nr:MAG: DUF2062 domain-containing protein [Desulfobacteraceae bacterium]
MIKNKIDNFIEKTKKLQGDPHYVSLGMGIGVFVGITPTIPFHTIFAIALAYLFRASRPAAYLGIWLCNPLTVIFLYIACYKVGLYFFGNPAESTDTVEVLIRSLESDLSLKEKWHVLADFAKTKAHAFYIMNLGGLILGIPGGIASYFITRWFFSRLRTSA